MKVSETRLFSPNFSHIYVEKDAFDYPMTGEILSKFKNSKIIEIADYKNVFCRSGQNIQIQKQSKKIILAVKKDNFYYKSPDICQSFGFDHAYYTSCVLNCIYNCDYCFLQGMYPSSNIVIFVNIDDYFSSVKTIIKNGKILLSISYDTDILAFEHITGYTKKWIDFSSLNPNLHIEIRTKSTNFSSMSNLAPLKNVIAAFTLSPDEIIKSYEHRTPFLDERLDSISKVISNNWKVRLCIDPILIIPDWKTHYENFINKIFSRISPKNITDIGVGVFRVPTNYLKNIRRSNIKSDVIFYPYQSQNNVSTYKNGEQVSLFICELLSKFIDQERIFT